MLDWFVDFLIGWFVFLVVSTIAIFWVKKVIYEKTMYYRQTGNRFLKVFFNLGLSGEYFTWRALRKLPGYKRFLFNCYVPKTGEEKTEIDVILLHESGIYVLESKNYSGWIFGTESQKYWTQTLPMGRKSHKEHFFNPILQNAVHLKWLIRYLGIDASLFYSYILFSRRCTLKSITLTTGEHQVMNRPKVLRAVRKNAKRAGKRLTPADIDAIYECLAPLTNVTEAQKQAHIARIERKKTGMPSRATPAAARPERAQEPIVASNTAQASSEAQEICPRCGGTLVLRQYSRGERAGQHFFGCSNYPKCRYTRSLEPL